MLCSLVVVACVVGVFCLSVHLSQFGRRTSVTRSSDDGHVMENLSTFHKVHVTHRAL